MTAIASVCWRTCTPELCGSCKPELCCMAVGADTPPSCVALAASLATFRLEAFIPAPATPMYLADEVDCTL